MDIQHKEKNIEKLNELRLHAIKVTEALYRTTDLFSDAEPLKWSLRDSAIKILNTISDISSQPTYQELRSAQALEKMIESLCYKLDLAVGGTFIAHSNFDILEREYKSLNNKINHTDFFNTLLIEEGINSSHQIPDDSILLDTLDNRTLVVQKSPIDSQMSNIIQEQQPNTQLTQTKEKKQINYGSPTSIATMEVGLPTKSVLSDRKNTILRLIKERGPSSVGDLLKLVDVSLSDKTIQRDLNAMADSGILKKEGEKRWRRYFL